MNRAADCLAEKQREHRRTWESQVPAIPYGRCWCGCGKETALAEHSAARRGLVKGCPRRYVLNHDKKAPAPQLHEEDRGYATPCHVWQGRKNAAGYGTRGKELAHRLIYER